MLVVAGIIEKNGKVLIAQRKEDCPREPLMWEFPGGKVERGETPAQSLKREIKEELGIEIDVGEKFLETSLEDKGVEIALAAYRARWKSGAAKAIDVRDFRWVEVEELGGFEFAKADVPIVEKLMAAGL